MEEKELNRLIRSCQKGERSSQDKLYKLFYGYGMGISLRYSRTKEEAVEIMNDAFVKVFTKMDKYTTGLSFNGWFRRILINSAIDYYRKNEKHYHSLDISHANYETNHGESAIEKMSAREIIDAVQLLPPSYRMVFNLYVMEGFKHDEIANRLNISVGTSKSNLSIARAKLQRMITSDTERQKGGQHGG